MVISVGPNYCVAEPLDGFGWNFVFYVSVICPKLVATDFL
jgi:hypothetical protein